MGIVSPPAPPRPLRAERERGPGVSATQLVHPRDAAHQPPQHQVDALGVGVAALIAGLAIW